MAITEHFDLEQVYDQQISPLMMQVIAIAKQHGIPCFATFLYCKDEDGEDYCTTLVPRGPEQQQSDAIEAAVAAFRHTFQTLTAWTTTITKEQNSNGRSVDGDDQRPQGG